MGRQFTPGDQVVVVNCQNESFNTLFVVDGKREHSYGTKPLIVAHTADEEKREELFHGWELRLGVTRYALDGEHCRHTVCNLA